MSRPILGRLGFREVCEIRILVDRFAGRRVRVSAKADYAIRAAVELAAAGDGPVKGDRIAQGAGHPAELPREHPRRPPERRASSARAAGPEGGYWLARPADEVSLADVIRAVDGPLANVRGVRSDQLEYEGSAEALERRVDRGPRQPARRARAGDASPTSRAGTLPDHVRQLAADPDAWAPH